MSEVGMNLELFTEEEIEKHNLRNPDIVFGTDKEYDYIIIALNRGEISLGETASKAGVDVDTTALVLSDLVAAKRARVNVSNAYEKHYFELTIRGEYELSFVIHGDDDAKAISGLKDLPERPEVFIEVSEY